MPAGKLVIHKTDMMHMQINNKAYVWVLGITCGKKVLIRLSITSLSVTLSGNPNTYNYSIL